MAEVLRTQCCIAGGGPAGAMLGLLLARRGLDVVVVEKHADFLRDFRGDTIHPSTMEVLDELGLIDAFLALDPNRVEYLTGNTPAGNIVALINRREYWQVAYVIRKGSAERLREAGIEELRATLRRLVPELGDRVDLLTGWDEVSVLSVQASRLRRWHRPGLLCIGDA